MSVIHGLLFCRLVYKLLFLPVDATHLRVCRYANASLTPPGVSARLWESDESLQSLKMADEF